MTKYNFAESSIAYKTDLSTDVSIDWWKYKFKLTTRYYDIIASSIKSTNNWIAWARAIT